MAADGCEMDLRVMPWGVPHCGCVLLQVTCMCMDQAGAMLWVGHSDGKVSGFSLKDSADSAVNNRRKYSWQVSFQVLTSQ